MTGFADDFPDDELMDVLGDTATYRRGLNEYPLKVVVNHNVERIGEQGVITAPHTEIEFLTGALGATFVPQRGDKIIVSGVRYNVDGVIADDGVYQTVVVRK